MKIALLIAVLFLNIGVTVAAAATDDELKQMLGARSSGQLLRVAKLAARLRHAKLVCDVQLRSGRIPLGCFEVVGTENQELEATAGKVDIAWLESLCVRRATASNDWRELAGAGQERACPERCRIAARTRLADLKYADQTDRPAELFARRRFEDRTSPTVWKRY